MGSMAEPASAPGRAAVPVAILTSGLGVLIGRRRDGKPPWTFPGGKIEPGESPGDAAARETLEDTGLQVRATGVIGERVHPVTGVGIVYVAAAPADETCDLAVPGRELAEVRWVGTASTEELMGDMAGVVREYMQRLLGS
jgi:8-oxo-dGTP diphosphatase